MSLSKLLLAGFTGYAWVRSGQESWAELESEPFSVPQDTEFAFRFVQTRLQMQVEDLIELLIVPMANPSATRKIFGVRSAVQWNNPEPVLLSQETGTIKVSVWHTTRPVLDQNLTHAYYVIASVSVQSRTGIQLCSIDRLGTGQ